MFGNQMARLAANQEIVQKLCCSSCDAYLSSVPVHLLKDGTNICSTCSASQNITEYKQWTLGTILKNAAYGCRFAKFNCNEWLLFPAIEKHELSCSYRPISCPSINITNCSWQGSVPQVSAHIMTHHKDLLEESKKPFKLNQDVSDKVIAVVVENDNVVVIKYSYDAAKFEMSYVSWLYALEGKSNCTIKIDEDTQIRSSNMTRFFHLKAVCFDHSSFEMEIISSVNLQAIVEGFQEPIYTLVWAQPPPVTTYPGLIPQTFPCRWPGCGYRTDRDILRRHETMCLQRIYTCMFPGCKAPIGRYFVQAHMKSHPCPEITAKFESFIRFTSTYSKPLYAYKYIDDEFFLVLGYMYRNRYILSVESSCFYDSKVKIYLHLSHGMLLKCKSKEFSTNDRLEITLTDLKSCCRDVDLTMTLEAR